MRSVKTLVVDDFEQFRRLVCSILKPRVEFQVIGEASDGLEAVRKTEELQPDLVLLDIGLPKLNGLEVAKHVRKLTPAAKIVFVSQESSTDVVEKALSLGALGYVHKSRALGDLIPAIDAVLKDKRFIGINIELEEQADVRSAQRHEVLFCSDDDVLLDGLARVIAAALAERNAVIVIAAESHRDGLLRRLSTQGVDIAAAIRQGACIPFEVHDVLSMFMIDDLPDVGRLSIVADDLVKGASVGANGEHRRVVVCSECACTLLAQGKAQAAIHLEHLWGAVGGRYDVDTLCVYPILDTREDAQVFKKVCAEHTAVLSR